MTTGNANNKKKFEDANKMATAALIQTVVHHLRNVPGGGNKSTELIFDLNEIKPKSIIWPKSAEWMLTKLDNSGLSGCVKHVVDKNQRKAVDHIIYAYQGGSIDTNDWIEPNLALSEFERIERNPIIKQTLALARHLSSVYADPDEKTVKDMIRVSVERAFKAFLAVQKLEQKTEILIMADIVKQIIESAK